MPYVFEIDTSAGVIRETWTGAFGYRELVESCQAEWAHPDYRPGLNLLTDFRRARGRITVDEVLKFASWFCNDDAPSRHAIVVRRERALDYSAMFSMIRESHKPAEERTRLFFSYAEADLWVTCRHVARPAAEHVQITPHIAASTS